MYTLSPQNLPMMIYAFTYTHTFTLLLVNEIQGTLTSVCILLYAVISIINHLSLNENEIDYIS